MKIAFFTEAYAPTVGGAIQVVVDLKKYLEKKGHTVYIFRPGKTDKKNNIYGCKKTWTSKGGAKGYGTSFPFFQDSGILKEVDIIHTHQPFFTGLAARRFAKKYKKKLIFTNHTQYHKYLHYGKYLIPTPISKKLLPIYLRWFTREIDTIIIPSKSMAKEVIKEFGYDPNKIKVISNFIEPPKKIDEKLTKKIKENFKGKIVLIYTGRLAIEKNMDFLINAFKLISKKVKNAHLILVGGGSEEEKLRKLSKKLNLEKKITFSGYIKPSEVYCYLKNSDIFVSASKSEVHPLTLLESMYMGVAPVTLNSNGFKDTITSNKNGILVKNETKEEFSNAVIKLILNKKELTRMKKEARKEAEKYTGKNLIEETEKVYYSSIKNI